MSLYNNLLVFLGLLLLAACNSEKSHEQLSERNESNSIEKLEFSAQFSNKKTLSVTDKPESKYQLDSLQYAKWTDEYTPFGTEYGRLYSAEIYSIQPQIHDITVLTLRTNGDHWNKLHLVTINEEQEMIDKIQVSNSWSDLIEQAGDTEIVGNQSMYTNMISPGEYQRFDIRTTEIINYYSDSITFEIDSVTTKIEILNNGSFELTRLDSIRKIKYGEID